MQNDELYMDEFDDDNLIDQVIKNLDSKKEEAKRLVESLDNRQALVIYKEILNDVINLSPREKLKINQQKFQIYYLIATCFYKQEKSHKAIEFCTYALDLKMINHGLESEVYLLRGLAMEKCGKDMDAFKEIQNAIQINPCDGKISQELERISTKTIQIENKALKPVCKDETFIEEIEKIKSSGINLYENEKLDESIREFSTGIELIFKNIKKEEMNQDKRIVSILIKLFNYRSAAFFKLDCNNEVKRDCKCVLNIDPSNVEALYRCGKAEGNSGFFEKAAKKMKTVCEIEPGNQDAKLDFDNFMKLAIQTKQNSRMQPTSKNNEKRSVRFSDEVKTFVFSNQAPPKLNEELKEDEVKLIPKKPTENSLTTNDKENAKNEDAKRKGANEINRKFIENAISIAFLENKSILNENNQITRTEFEKNIQNFKNDHAQILSYIVVSVI